MGVKLVLLPLVAIIGLELLARRLRLPPAPALLVGGAAMAFVPGLPRVNLACWPFARHRSNYCICIDRD